jgi:hypothetical protein
MTAQSSPDLSGVRLKLERAAVHLQTIYQSIAVYLHDCADIFDISVDTNGNCRITIKLEHQPDPVWGVLIGDFVHNARSALDHLVWQLVLNNNRRPSISNYFPVCLSRAKWDAGVAKRSSKRSKSPLAGVHPKHVEMIRKTQPFVVSTRGRPECTRLALLNAMWNLDKHRFLHAGVLLADPNGGNAYVQFDGTVCFSDFRIHVAPRQPLAHGDLFATFRLQEHPLGTNLQVTPTTPLEVNFNGLKPGPLRASDLTQLLAVASEIVDSFRDDFA